MPDCIILAIDRRDGGTSAATSLPPTDQPLAKTGAPGSPSCYAGRQLFCGKFCSSRSLAVGVNNRKHALNIRSHFLPTVATLIGVLQHLANHDLVNRTRQFFHEGITGVELLVLLFVLMGVRVELNHTRRSCELWCR